MSRVSTTVISVEGCLSQVLVMCEVECVVSLVCLHPQDLLRHKPEFYTIHCDASEKDGTAALLAASRHVVQPFLINRIMNALS